MQLFPGITLGQALKVANVVGSGGEAKVLIQTGEVRVNGKVETRRGLKLRQQRTFLIANVLTQQRRDTTPQFAVTITVGIGLLELSEHFVDLLMLAFDVQCEPVAIGKNTPNRPRP